MKYEGVWGKKEGEDQQRCRQKILRAQGKGQLIKQGCKKRGKSGKDIDTKYQCKGKNGKEINTTMEIGAIKERWHEMQPLVEQVPASTTDASMCPFSIFKQF